MKRAAHPWDTDETVRARWHMVEEQIIQRGIRDPRVLKAVREVPRHVFVPDRDPQWAYIDAPIPVGWGQTISQPYIVALMSEALEVKGEERRNFISKKIVWVYWVLILRTEE